MGALCITLGGLTQTCAFAVQCGCAAPQDGEEAFLDDRLAALLAPGCEAVGQEHRSLVLMILMAMMEGCAAALQHPMADEVDHLPPLPPPNPLSPSFPPSPPPLLFPTQIHRCR